MEELPAHLRDDVPGGGKGVEDGTEQGEGEGDKQYDWAHMRDCGTKGRTSSKDKRRIQGQVPKNHDRIRARVFRGKQKGKSPCDSIKQLDKSEHCIALLLACVHGSNY